LVVLIQVLAFHIPKSIALANMSGLLTILIAVNLCWSAYLTFLFYRRHQKPSANKFSGPIKTNNKIKLFRFNPFNDVGGDQSFILTLLDETNSGIVLTSLHNRNITRVYAKPIKNGEGEISLSNEEKNAIFKTINS
jgi:hypothetical protein